MDKEKLNELAMTYLGTPHINGGNLKGAGLDCCTLPANIFKELLGIDIPITFGYSPDWFMRYGCKEILLPYLEQYCVRAEELEVGDVISYSWGRAQYAHLAIFLGDNRVVHCSADFGVEIEDFDAPYFYDGRGKSRITGYWRLKDELI